MILFLTSTLNISDEGARPIFAGCYAGATPKILLPHEMNFENTEVVVFNAPAFIEFFRKHKISLPKSIVDVFQIFKIIDGRPIKYHKWSEARRVYSIFKTFIQNDDELKSVVKILDSNPEKVF